MTLTLDAERDLRLIFVTPLIRFTVPDHGALCAALREIVLRMEKEDPGATRSNAGGWHSGDTLATSPEPAIAKLRGHIQEAALFVTGVVTKAAVKPGSMHIQAWANINRRGHYNQMHNHPLYHWSAVFYVDMGEPDPANPLSGLIEFQDPRGPANMSGLLGAPFGSNYQVRPEAGEIILFPSWLYHWVHPFTGGGTRISTAWNIRMNAYWLEPGSLKLQ